MARGRPDESGFGRTAAMTVPSRLHVDDPWGVSGEAVTESRVRRTILAVASMLVAAVLGAAGPVMRLAVDGFGGRALVFGAIALGWVVSLSRRSVRGTAFAVVGGVAAATGCVVAGSRDDLVRLLVVGAAVVLAVDALASPLASRSVPLTVPVLAGAQVAWFRDDGSPLAWTLLAGAFAVAVARRRSPGPFEALERGIASGVQRPAHWLGSLVMFVVALVVLYAPGFVGAAAVRIARAGTSPSYWTSRDRTVVQERRDARRPFATAEVRAVRRRHLVGVAVVAVVVGAMLIADGRDGGDVAAPRRTVDSRSDGERRSVFEVAADRRLSDLEAFADAPWADDLKDEQDRLGNEFLLPSDVGGYDVADFAGRFTNVRDGVRRSYESSGCPGCHRVVVWLVGGSAAFGMAQRDEHTIASQLVRIAEADGVHLEVVNLGVPGWTLYQERQKVEAALGSTPTTRLPDMVVFHDGFNDVIGTMISSTVRGIDPKRPTLLASEDVVEFTDRALDPREIGTAEEIGNLAARAYRREMSAATAVLEGRSIPARFVLQPDAFSAPQQLEPVSDIVAGEPELVEFVVAVFDHVQRSLAPDVIDLRDLFDEERSPVFADLVHTNERGATLVASALYDRIRPDLLAAATAAR